MLEYNRYSFGLVFKKKVAFRSLPSFIFRNNIGFQLKKITCILKNNECADCVVKATCIYASVFETIVDKNNEILKGRNKAPHPYMVYTGTPAGEATDRLILDVVLIGVAVKYFPYILLAILNISKSGILKERIGFDIDDISCRGESVLDKANYSCKNVSPSVWNYVADFGASRAAEFTAVADIASAAPAAGSRAYAAGAVAENEVQHAKACLLRSFAASGIIASAKPDAVDGTVKINFAAPVRLQHNGKYLRRITYKDFLYAAARRIILLESFFGDGKNAAGVGNAAALADILNDAFIESAAEGKEFDASGLKWTDYSRYSARQKVSMKLGGLVGTASVTGRFSETELSLLRAAELFGIGKNTSFGLGRVEVNRNG